MKMESSQSEIIYNKILRLMGDVNENYSDTPEYKSIMMSLKSVSKEITLIRLREVGGITETEE